MKTYIIQGQRINEEEYIRILQGHIYRYESETFLDPSNKTWCSKEEVLEAIYNHKPPKKYITAYVFINGRWEYVNSIISRARGCWP